MNFASALARNRPPRTLGPVRLRYDDSCLLLDVAVPAWERRLRSSLEGAALGAGACTVGLVAWPEGPGPLAALGTLVLGAGLLLGGAVVRPPVHAAHRCALLFDAEAMVLEFPAALRRPARSERIPFDAVTSLQWEREEVVLCWEREDGTEGLALLVRGVRGARARMDVESLLARMRTMLALNEAGARRGSPPPSRTSARVDPPTSG